MKLYDDVIKKCETLFVSTNTYSSDYKKVSWTDKGKGNLIMRSDMAYELGGGNLPAPSVFAVTEDEELVSDDEIIVCGNDLSEIKESASYARMTFVRVKKDALADGNEAYQAIKAIEFSKYRVNPEGFMMRISSTSEREPVRIGKKALADGLDFKTVGDMFIREYHKNPYVEAVQIVFITDLDIDYKKIEAEASFASRITVAMDHVLKDFKMDCHTCKLKDVCDEVEGMRELHFGHKSQQ